MAIQWSYTALTAFETCPKQFFHTRIAKDVQQSFGPEADWGNRVHKALEEYLRDGKPLITGTTQHQGMADRFKGAPGTLFVEQELPITASFTPCGWWDKTVWCRGKADVLIRNGSKLFIGDWKTGKMKEDADQLRLFSALGMHHYPEVSECTVAYLWLKDNKLTAAKFTRDDLPKIWNDFIPRVAAMEKAAATGDYPPRPSGLCRKHCPVKQCQFCGG